METLKAKGYYWDGHDMIVETEDGKVFRFTNAVITARETTIEGCKAEPVKVEFVKYETI